MLQIVFDFVVSHDDLQGDYQALLRPLFLLAFQPSVSRI
jgi:hypothetical protein